jgi:hypothetical protein
MSDSTRVGISPLTNKIYAGRVLKDGVTWGAGTSDVTGEAINAVARHLFSRDEAAIVRLPDGRAVKLEAQIYEKAENE